MPVSSGLYYTENKPLNGRFVENENTRPVIVLIHGAGGSQLSWPVEIRRLSGFRVLAIDLPGHGKSTGIALQNVDAYARVIKDFLRELGVFSVVMVGHSLGAAIAIQFALENRDQVQGLALLSAATCFPIPKEIFQAVADVETYSIGLTMLKQRSFSHKTSAETKARCMQALEKQRNTILFSDFVAASRVDFREGFDQFEIPCWTACGSDDLITPPSLTQELGRQFKKAEFTEISSAGHSLPMEQPGVLANGLQRFLTNAELFPGVGPQKN